MSTIALTFVAVSAEEQEIINRNLGLSKPKSAVNQQSVDLPTAAATLADALTGNQGRTAPSDAWVVRKSDFWKRGTQTAHPEYPAIC